MKGYVSLLKGGKIKKNKNKNSLFLLKKPQEENKFYTNEFDDLLPKFQHIKNIENKVKDSKKVIKLIKRTSRIIKPCEDYEELFFYFLKIPQKIDLLRLNSIESKTKEKDDINTYESEFEEDDFIKESNNIDIKKIFYKRIYLGLIEKDKQYYENYYFPKAIFKIIYKKSRLKQKEILEDSIKYGINYDAILNTYEKVYTNKLKKKNWDVDPITAYKNYMEIYNKNDISIQNKEMEKKKVNIFDNIEMINKFNKDIVVKTFNKGCGKTLIFNGKLLNVYVVDYLRNNNENYMISINSPVQKKKEIIYDKKKLLPKLKQCFSLERNNFSNKYRHTEVNNHRSRINIKQNLINLKTNIKNDKELILNNKKENNGYINTICSSFNNKRKQINKRNLNSFNDIHKRNEELKMNKYFFSPDFSNHIDCNKNNYKYISHEEEEPPNLFLKRIKNNTQSDKNKKNKYFFNFIKFSYYK